MLACISYFTYPFFGVERRVRDICLEIKPGMPIDELKALALRSGLTQPHQSSGVVFLVETRSFGRWGCQVVLEAGRVTQSDYDFAD